MDLNFLKGMAEGEHVASSDNTMNYIVMKTPQGDITFTYEGDDRIENVFKDYEKIGLITQSQHSELLNTMNTCEWDLKVDYVDGEFTKIEKYTKEEKDKILTERAYQEEVAFFNKEKSLALAITEDYNLQLEPITDEQIGEVRNYMKSIRPKSPDTPMVMIAMPLVQRPIIMEVYEAKLEENKGWY